MLDTREAPEQTAETSAAPRTRTAPRTETRVWLRDRVSAGWAYGLLAGWYGLFLLVQVLQPEPEAHTGMLAWIGAVMSFVFLGALVVTGMGLAVRQRWGLVASLGASGFLVADSIACPLTGHHQFGAFIVVQAVASVALAGASIRALRRT
jgi:hypothetical protein